MLRVAAIAFFAFFNLAASAEQWPSRPVRLIVPYAAGGGTDIVARALAQRLADALGQPFVVENKPGGTGIIAGQTVARAASDGYTLLVATPNEVVVNPAMFAEAGYRPQSDLIPVALIASTPFVLAAHPSLRATTVKQLVSLSRSQPLNYSIPGVGSLHHLIGQYVNALQSAQLVHVPYRGAAPAVTDAVSGHVQLTIAGLPAALAFIRSEQLKPIAVTSRERSPIVPEVPAMAETAEFKDADFSNWFGLLAPAGTGAHVVESLAKTAVAALNDPKLRETLETQAAVPVGFGPDQFGAFIRSEATRYATVLALTGAK
jgi:tripartite-type tricarboxylate transporter receptor subunit TctC